MAARRINANASQAKRPPATTPHDREMQLVAATIDLAEKQILDGTASSQVMTHFLKLGSSREQLEQERLRNENDLMRAKIEQMASQKEIEKLYGEALSAMRAYGGQAPLPMPQADFDD